MSDTQVEERANLLACALAYAKRGWKVFPCQPGGKKPLGALVPQGLKEATDDPSQTQRWWTEKPEANIGIRTGRVSGFFAIDIDAQHGGLASWAILTDKHGEIRTANVRTPSGGMHLYFRCSEKVIKNSVSKIAPGIDVRGENAYVVGAGSRTTVGDYLWSENVSIVDPPRWLLQLVAATDRQFRHSRELVLREGTRNDALTSLAGCMRRHGASMAAIAAALQHENRCRCRPPLSRPEVAAIARSVSRYPPADSSAASGNGDPAVPILSFKTAEDLAREAPPEPRFVIHGYAACGCVSELTGPPKRAGKTTLLAFGVSAVLNGSCFLGHLARKGPVVWLTEESMATFAEPLKLARIWGRPDLHVLSWHDTGGVDWPQIVRAAADRCRRVGAEFLIIDTLPQFAGLRGDAENNSGDALRVVDPVRRAANEYGLAVMAVRHDRKGGGDVGESGRGSSAFAAAVDITIAMRRPEGKTRPTVRMLHALSRFSQTPPTLVTELTSTGYVALGSEAAVAILEAKRALVEDLPTREESAIGIDELRTRFGIPRTVLQDALKELVGNQVTRIGKGKKNDAYRYFRPVVVSAATLINTHGGNGTASA
ncbi:MAG TPA: bifunctional DNA primase/polymerase [Vicinamibacterales bacterium]|nr:bifunctional DNA primase/polymerase [Vicinamibacterales bacterium]